MSETSEREIPVSFSSFIISLASSAMVHLGEVPDPVEQEPRPNLALARQTIDVLGLLQKKTEGNLDEEEEELLESLLYDLRLKFVEKRKESEGKEPAPTAD